MTTNPAASAAPAPPLSPPTPPDPHDVRLALRASPLLRSFNVAGLLTAADVHVAQRLGSLAGEPDETVRLAVALAVRGVRSGSVCLALDDVAELAAEVEVEAGPVDLPWPAPAAWRAAIERSPAVAAGPVGGEDRPVRWVDGRLYLDRYWRDEQVVRREVDARLAAPPPAVDARALRDAVVRLFPGADDARQRLAAATAAVSPLTVLTGGPGTGKTTTVARVLAILQQVGATTSAPGAGAHRPGLRVALAAPTGKAAARLKEAVHEQVAGLDPADRAAVGDLEAMTIHRLLGWRHDSSTRFRHDRARRLPHDVVVIDETSMVSLPLMARLLEALRPGARLLLVGDPDQLASVEAGAVLGDLVRRPPAGDGPLRALDGPLADLVSAAALTPSDLTALRAGVVRLTVNHRFDGTLGRLAAAIRDGEADAVVHLLRSGDPKLVWVETGAHPTPDQLAGLRDDVRATGTALLAAARAGDGGAALRALESHRLLLAHRRGPAGVAHWADVAAAWTADPGAPDQQGPWPLGLPLLVTTNDRDTGLFNGDTCVVVDDGKGGRMAVFGDPERPQRISPHRLPAVVPVHAMTVHRAQGSQFARVSLLLPPATSPLLTRQLLYTAATRARQAVRIIGSEEAVRTAVGREVRRASGLGEGPGAVA
ncbi:exodeoxyribonuclease V subunit alpha [Actinotalea sp. JY-7885]|uniref:exodeoxyribonuclease V subunit alpha n=1 Tax=Actinotalea sp. JY-7885 TaxID=2758576 RepID=UPI00165D6AB2|nr:exodeoxyribonuclease V subunit alpha [Actinotalea sp. JY-7885]